MNTATVRDLLRLALPPGSVLLTPESGLAHHVGAAASLRATHPAFPQLRGGEIALVSVAQARLLDERLTLPTIVRRLSEVAVGAIAVLGDVDEEALGIAQDIGLPLIALPSQSDLRGLEREIQRLLIDPDLQIERRAAQLYSELTQQIATADGAEGILRLLADRTDCAAALLSSGGEVRLRRGPRHLRGVFADLDAPIQPVQQIAGVTVRALPIGTPAQQLGMLALAGPMIDRWDELAMEQAGNALALEMAKQQAIQAAEARVRGDVLRTILSGTIADPASLQQQALELGYNLHQPHVGLLIAAADGSALAEPHYERLRRLLARMHLGAPSLLREGWIVCFCPSDEQRTQPAALLDAFAADVPIAAGISTIVTTPAQWPRAYDEAEQALTLGRPLFGPRSYTAFGDLGVYRLLFELRESSELRGFYHQTLGKLVDHDRANGGELLHTLEGYFAALGNLHQAAELLHIHRNTLIYRLRRIGEISGLNLKRSEDVLALQIALKAHRILTRI